MRFLSASLLVLLSTAASAEPLGVTAEAPDPMISVGARIGGYGFRRDGNTSFTGEWNECRMNGVGVFVRRRSTARSSSRAGSTRTSRRRITSRRTSRSIAQSVLVSAAIGVRSHFTSWLDWLRPARCRCGARPSCRSRTPTTRSAQTRSCPRASSGSAATSSSTRAVHVGASIRTLVMGNFNYDPARLDMNNQMWTSTPTADQVFSATPTLATQVQFFLRLRSIDNRTEFVDRPISLTV